MNKNNFFGEKNHISIGGKVMSKSPISIKDFNNIKCPFCGTHLEVIGMDSPGSEYSYRNIEFSTSTIDDMGKRHTMSFGKHVTETENKLLMRCPMNCIEEMTVNVLCEYRGPYQEFVDLRQMDF